MRKWFLILLVFTAFPVTGFARMHEDEALSKFIKGNFAYKDARYDEAAKIYEQILAGGVASGPVHYNLGNSYFKAGKLGKAILEYERARQLMPRDSDLRMNYRYALGQRKSQTDIFGRSRWDRIWQSHAEFYSFDEMSGILFAAAAFAGLFYVLSLYLFGARRQLRWLTVGALTMFSIYLYGFVSKAQAERDLAVAVKECESKFEPRTEATTHFTVPEGTRVRWRYTEGLWSKIKRIDGKEGWVPADSVERVSVSPK